MALLFAYGTLQLEKVQLETLGRRLDGRGDELLGFARSLVKIEDPAVVAATGTTHHNNVTFTGKDVDRVSGMAFEVTDNELEDLDRYEAGFSYERVAARLASGRDTWVYIEQPQ
jgi:hypothetical protein